MTKKLDQKESRLSFKEKFKQAVELEDIASLQELFSKHKALKTKRCLDRKYSGR